MGISNDTIYKIRQKLISIHPKSNNKLIISSHLKGLDITGFKLFSEWCKDDLSYWDSCTPSIDGYRAILRGDCDDTVQSLDMAQHFLTLLDEEEDKFTFQYFADNNKEANIYPKCFHDSLENSFDKLVKLNNQGYGIFITVNKTDGKGRLLNNCEKIRAVFQEIDYGLKKQNPIEPSFIVESSPGKYHNYFVCDGLSKYEYSGVMRSMIAEYGSDKNAKDLVRVLRLPGFLHQKDPKKPHLVNISHESGLQRYSKKIILKEFPVLKEEKKVSLKSTNISIIVDNESEQVCINRIIDIMQKTSTGTRHGGRLGAAKLAGGFVGGGFLSEQKAMDVLVQISDSISDSGKTSNSEYKTLIDGMEYGKAEPINDVFFKREYQKKGNFDNIAPEIQEWNSNLSKNIDYIIPFDCVQRDIQLLILSRSMYPQPALAYIAAMITVAACIGRNISYDNIKGNMMFIGMAESGEGEDFPFKYVKKILKAVGMADRVEGRPASGAAFFEALESNNSMLLHIDEYGHFLNGVNGRGASVYAKEVVSGLTECYTSASDTVYGKRTKGVDPIKIDEPNICVFGMSTEGQIFNGLSSGDVADGSLARYMMVFGDIDIMPVRINNYDDTIPANIIQKLQFLINGTKIDSFQSSKNIRVSEEYANVKFELSTNIKAKSIKSKNPMFKPFYNRIVVRATQSSLLVDRCSDVNILRWFVDLETQSCEMFVKKFLHLGADNENEKMAKLLQSKIKESGKRGITHKKLHALTRQVNTLQRKMMLDEMIEHNTVFVKEETIKGSQKKSKVYYWIK